MRITENDVKVMLINLIVRLDDDDETTKEIFSDCLVDTFVLFFQQLAHFFPLVPHLFEVQR